MEDDFVFFISVCNGLIKGGWRTRLSHFIIEVGKWRCRPIKGIIYLLIQVAYLFMFIPGGGITWLSKFDTLGDVAVEYVEECIWPPGTPIDLCDADSITTKPIFRDNSLLIMLFSVATIIITIIFLVIYFMQVRGAFKGEKAYVEAKAKYEALKADGSEENLIIATTFGEELKFTQ